MNDALTESTVIENAHAFLEENPNKDSLIAVIEELEKRKINHPQLDLWKIFSVFDTHLAHQTRFYDVTGFYFSETDKDEHIAAIQTLKKYIAQHTDYDQVYIIVASYYFSKGKDAKARKVLRDGIEYARHTGLIKLYYCQNMAVNARNTKVIEKYLLSIINNPKHYSELIHFKATSFLQHFYLAVAPISKAASFLYAHPEHDIRSLPLALGRYALSATGAITDPTVALIEWGDQAEKRFLDSAPEGFLSEGEGVISYFRELFITKLLASWRQKPESFIKQLIDKEKELYGEGLYDEVNDVTAKAGQRLLLILSDSPQLHHDSDFWWLMYFYSMPLGHYCPKEALLHISRLHQRYPSLRLKRIYLRYIAWWGDRKEIGSQLVRLLFEDVMDQADGDETDLDSDYYYDLLIPNEPDSGARPLPYFIDSFIEAFQHTVYPKSFVVGVWRHLVRPITTREDSHKDRKIMTLIDIFNSLLPNSDPAFIKGWNLTEEGKYSDAMVCFQQLLNTEEVHYGVYRNLSYCASKMNNATLAYDYEKAAHDNPDITVPDDRDSFLETLYREVKQERDAAALVKDITHFYTPKSEYELQVERLSLLQTIKLIALVEHFSIPGTSQCRALFSLPYHWLPSRDASYTDAIQMISDRTLYLTNPIHGEGLTPGDDGGYKVDFARVSIAPNLSPYGDWPLLLGQLYKRIEALLLLPLYQQGGVPEELQPILAMDLEEYARERYDAYGININFNARFQETAEHCLEKFPLKVCYGILYHEIEDAAAKQREDSMTDKHTVNFGLSSARGKADRAKERGWDLLPYEREGYAASESAVIRLINNLDLLDTVY